MSFAIWLDPPPFAFTKDDREQIYQVGNVWVVTDDPARTTQAAVDEQLARRSPDVAGFIQELKASMGGIVSSNALAKAYPLFQPALEQQVWADASALVIDALARGVLSAPQYQVFQQLAAKYALPLQLP